MFTACMKLTSAIEDFMNTAKTKFPQQKVVTRLGMGQEHSTEDKY